MSNFKTRPTIEHNGVIYEPVESPKYIKYCEDNEHGYLMGVNTEHRTSIRKTFKPVCYFINTHMEGFEEFNGKMPRPYVDTIADGTYRSELQKRDDFLNSMESRIIIPKGTLMDNKTPIPKISWNPIPVTPESYDGKKYNKFYLDEFGMMELQRKPEYHIETPEPPQVKFIIGIDPYQQEESQTGDSHSWVETRVKEAENRLKTESDIMGIPYKEQEAQKDKLNLGWYKKFDEFKKKCATSSIALNNKFMSPQDFNDRVLGHPDGYKTMSNEEFQKEMEERTEHFKLDTSEEIVNKSDTMPNQQLQADKLMKGNIVKYCDQYVQVLSVYRNDKVELGYFTDSIGFERNLIDPNLSPVLLTPEILGRCPDFKKHGAHPLIGDSYTMDIGRQRRIVVSNVHNGNQMITIQEYDRKDLRKTTDLVVIWNFDYDGRIMLHRFQNIIQSLTGTPLKIEL